MTRSLETLVDRVADRVAGRQPWRDILEDAPDLAIEEAYRIQFGLMERLVKAGDAVIGYKAAYTSLAMQRERGTGGPIVGALLRSANLAEGAPIPIVPDTRNAVEPEVAILLKEDLRGPGITATDVYAATAGLIPAIEIAVGAPGGAERSRHMVIATHKTFGSIVLGRPLHDPAGLDLRLEGTMVTVNGEVRGSATAVEVMGDPYSSAAFIANLVAEHDRTLRKGMILMTGSIVAAIPVAAGDEARVDFTRLGSVSARFAD